MSASTTTIDGWIASEPRETQTADGHTILNVDIPVQRSKYNRDTKAHDRIGETTWYQIALWDDDARLWAPLLSKGTRLLVVGVPEAHPYLKRDGSAGVSVRMLFPTIGVIPSRPKSDGPGRPEQPPADDWYPADAPADDEPF